MFKNTIHFSVIITLIAIIKLSCSSSEETKQENAASEDSLKYLISIPPGTADIKAEIIEFSEEKENYLCQIKILEVFEYGASISPLPPGTEIKAYIPISLVERESQKIKEKEIILARISQIRAPGDKEYWEIIMFNK